MTPSIAFCISGQLRDEDLSLPAVAELARRFSADVFISTWSMRGAKSSGYINVHQAARLFGYAFERLIPRSLVEGNALIDTFPGLEPLLDDRSPTDREALLAWFPGAVLDVEDATLLDLRFDQPDVRDNNSRRMLYKIWRCNQLKRQRERELGRRYDVVLRLRPDVVPALTPELLHEATAENVYYLPGGERTPGHLEDLAALCGSPEADYYCALFATAIASPERPWRHVHTELADHLAAKGATIRDLPLRQHITSADEVRQPRNRRSYISEFARSAEVALGLTRREQSQLLAAFVAVDQLLLGRPAGELLDSLSDWNAAELSEAVLYTLTAAFGTLNAAAARPRRTFGWVTLSMLAAAGREEPLSDFNAHDQVEGWERLLRQSGTPETPRAYASLGEAKQDLAAFRTSPAAEAAFAAIERLGPDMNGYNRLRLRLVGYLRQLDVGRFWPAIHAGRMEEAKGIAEGLCASGDDWLGPDLLGHYHAAWGDLDQALHWAEVALDRDPQHPGLIARVGSLLHLRGDPAASVPYFERAAAGWADPRPRHWLALALEALGERARAEAALQSALELDPANADMLAMRTRLSALSGLASA